MEDESGNAGGDNKVITSMCFLSMSQMVQIIHNYKLPNQAMGTAYSSVKMENNYSGSSRLKTCSPEIFS